MDLQNTAVNIHDKGYEHPNCTICETFYETISRWWIPGGLDGAIKDSWYWSRRTE